MASTFQGVFTLGQHGDELSFGEPGFTLVETVAFAIHLQNVHIVRQPIEQRRLRLVFAQDEAGICFRPQSHQYGSTQ
jgi:hypothetical protein